MKYRDGDTSLNTSLFPAINLAILPSCGSPHFMWVYIGFVENTKSIGKVSLVL